MTPSKIWFHQSNLSTTTHDHTCNNTGLRGISPCDHPRRGVEEDCEQVPIIAPWCVRTHRTHHCEIQASWAPYTPLWNSGCTDGLFHHAPAIKAGALTEFLQCSSSTQEEKTSRRRRPPGTSRRRIPPWEAATAPYLQIILESPSPSLCSRTWWLSLSLGVRALDAQTRIDSRYYLYHV